MPDGFYWVKLTNTSRWEPAELIGHKWYVIGAGRSNRIEKFAAIGPIIEQYRGENAETI